MIGKVWVKRAGGYDPSRVPSELDTIADVVLHYKPKPKSKASKRRAKRKRQADANKG
jgi:hypothetical protein